MKKILSISIGSSQRDQHYHSQECGTALKTQRENIGNHHTRAGGVQALHECHGSDTTGFK